MFIHVCCSLNRCMKMFNHRDDKTNSELSPLQSRACSCNCLPCLPLFCLLLTKINCTLMLYTLP